MLGLWREILDANWAIKDEPLAVYRLKGGGRLVLCGNGLYEIDETREYMRFSGKEGRLEMSEWIRPSIENDGSGSEDDAFNATGIEH